VVVWDLEIPPSQVAAVAAVCDGYENQVQLRSKQSGGPGSFAAWVAPAFRAEVAALMEYLVNRFGVAAAGPRPFGENDLAEGMHLPSKTGGADT
jgi:hypothetical protein